MNPQRHGWDWWSEAKLQVLKDYLGGFTTAVRGKSPEAIYLDLFAGSFENDRRYGTGTFPGSSQISLNTQPQFTRLAFFELQPAASDLRSDIRRALPGDCRWQVESGDSNATLESALSRLDAVRWAPTFAFLDPCGLQVAWSTVQTLAAWRQDKKTKVEQWILMPEPAIARVLGVRGVRGKRSAERLDRFFGSKDWIPIHRRRTGGAIKAQEMRGEFVNLYRWRLEKELGYKTTHALQIVNTAGNPVYTLIFATDSEPGAKIMDHIYNSAATVTIPAMQTHARAACRRRRDDEAGLCPLPGMDEMRAEPVEPMRNSYEHEPPWEPEPYRGEALRIDDNEPDIDPDDIDWEGEADDRADRLLEWEATDHDGDVQDCLYAAQIAADAAAPAAARRRAVDLLARWAHAWKPVTDACPPGFSQPGGAPATVSRYTYDCLVSAAQDVALHDALRGGLHLIIDGTDEAAEIDLLDRLEPYLKT